MDTKNHSLQKYAKIAGLAYLMSFITLLAVNFDIFARLIVGNNPAETAGNILANGLLFRIGIAGDIIFCVGIIVVIPALYVILKRINPFLALFAAIARLIYGFMWLVVVLNLFTALRLLNNTGFAHAFGQKQLQFLANLYLSGSGPYYTGLLFWSIAATLIGYLWMKSGFIPKVLGLLAVISGAWCFLCTFVYYIFPGFETIVNLWWFDTPMVLVEIAISFWLLLKGLRLSEATEIPV